MSNTIALMLDCSRNAVPNVKFLKQYIDILAKCGYNQLQLYMEDTYKIDGEKFFGYFRGGYTKEELKDLDNYALGKGIELVPAIQVLGHLGTIFNWGEYQKVHDTGDCLLAGLEETYELIEKMIKQVKETFHTNKVNVGMDESFWSGKGQYLTRFGYRNSDDIYLDHLKRVSEILNKYNLQGMMWGDMFFRNANNNVYFSKTPKVSENTKKMIPSNINLIYWDYYNEDLEMLEAMGKSFMSLDKNSYFAGGAWNWIGFMPRCDFANRQSKTAIRELRKVGIKDFILTAWGDNGAECAKLAILPTLYYFAQLVKGIDDDEQIKANFKKEFNCDFDELVGLKDINDLDKKPQAVNNVCKYMLYNDLLAGIYDNTVDQGKRHLFNEAKNRYAKNINDGFVGYVYQTAYDLANVMDLKYDMGVRIRKAYKANDNDALKVIINDLDELVSRIEKFYQSFKKQWYKENNIEGFEVQTARIGGLIQRCKEVKDLLISYLNKEIDEIHTLEQDILPFEGNKEGDDIPQNLYAVAASVNNM